MNLSKIVELMNTVRDEKEELKDQLLNLNGQDLKDQYKNLKHEKLKTRSLLLDLIKYLDQEKDQKRIINIVNNLDDDISKIDNKLRSYDQLKDQKKLSL